MQAHGKGCCPGCGQRSTMVIGDGQAWCQSEDCQVWVFDPGLEDGGLSKGFHEIDTSGWDFIFADPPADPPRQ